jgi:transposase
LEARNQVIPFEAFGLGVDEIAWGRGLRADNFLTIIDQIDAHCRRPLWVGKRRSPVTLQRGLNALGPEVFKGLRLSVATWGTYLQMITAKAGPAMRVSERSHFTTYLNQAVDEIRRAECSRLRAAGKVTAQRLKQMRWPLLRRGSGVRGLARQKLKAQLAGKLATAWAWELKELSHFWKYKAVIRAGTDYRCFRAMRSCLPPMPKVARMLGAHEELLLN